MTVLECETEDIIFISTQTCGGIFKSALEYLQGSFCPCKSRQSRCIKADAFDAIRR